MKKNIMITAIVILSIQLHAQPHIQASENLLTEGIPDLPSTMIQDVKSYTESRSAAFMSWHPQSKEILISTRFANSSQIHRVKSPGADRRQMTFFDEPVSSASYEPVNGNYFLFQKDMGGNEFFQIFRHDISTQKNTLLTDGKRSQNGDIRWSCKGDRIAYSSTKRNGQDRDIYIMDPLNPDTEQMIAENKGGSWRIKDWSPDDTKLLLEEGVSISESRLYILDLSSGVKSRILPKTDERTTFYGVAFANKGKGFYLISNRENEFNRLAYYDLNTSDLSYITSDISWDVEDAALSDDGRTMAFITNEQGLSKIYLLNTRTNDYNLVDNLPPGVVRGLHWNSDSRSIGITLTAYNASSDAYEYNIESGEWIQWTESELGGIDPSALQEPELISWNSFDGKQISGYLYKASPKFTGKRPVIINIHGGPEGQSRPGFIGSTNYYLNELGISVIYPNVRGSTGFGKSFVDADNGFKREESVQDIGSLLDWIAQQDNLDKDRIMVMGGSYGGYMTLAVSYLYSEKIRCAIDVVGISHFTTFMKNTEAYRRDLRRVEYGDERDPAMAAYFEKIAPLNHTDQIKKPLFIVQGGNDPRVPASESIQMKEKIKQQGGTVWFLMAKDEGHGFKKKNNIDFQFYSTIAFIKQYLIN